MFKHMRKLLIGIAALMLSAPVSLGAEHWDLPTRMSPIPKTTEGVPHIQLGLKPKQELSDGLLDAVARFPGVKLAETVISLPGAVGFQLERSVELSRPQSIVGGREFAHMHPDGSLHASLDPDLARLATQKGWATPHPWSDKRAGWEGFVMIFTPTTPDELDVVVKLVESSYSYVTGNDL